MNLLRPILLLWAFILATLNASAQGTFQNLNFEAANIPNGTPARSFVPVASALPGWNAYFTSGTGVKTFDTQVAYDGISLGGVAISVNDTNAGLGFVPFQGKYSAFLFGGQNLSASISQTGLVPSNTKSLQLEIYSSGTPFIVLLGGQAINMIPLGTVSLPTFPNSFTLYRGDISSFAGQVAELSFTQPPPPGTPPSSLFLDSIVFSPSPVPEPDTHAIFLCGAAVFGFYRWTRKR
jgi:hypothetical protein